MKSILIGILIGVCLLVYTLFACTPASAETPRFKLHVLKGLAPGVNYSVNWPVAFDYDGDGDQDIIIISKEGVIYVLENQTTRNINE